MTLDLDHLKKLAMAATDRLYMSLEYRNSDTSPDALLRLAASMHRFADLPRDQRHESIIRNFADDLERIASSHEAAQVCECCDGSGQVSDEHVCFDCNGKGYIAALSPATVLELIRLAEKAPEPMLTTDTVPIEKRGKLCTVCGKIVPELEAEAHCAGHGNV